METIQVAYKVLPSGYFYHKYILYTDSNGDVFYARGGPAGPSVEGTIDWLSGDGSLLWGNIETEHGAYVLGTKDWDAEGDDPSELIASGADLSAVWQQITLAIDAIELEGHVYDPYSSNSNTTVDEALVRAGLPEPQQDDLFEYWSPASGANLNPDPNEFTAYTGSAADLVGYIVRAHPGIEVVGTPEYSGAAGAASTFVNLQIGETSMPFGIALTSGDGTPPLSNTSGGYTVNNGTSGDADLTNLVQSFFPNTPETFDAASLSFTLSISDPDVKSIMFDVVFGSDEYPEYADSFVDVAAVFVNGVNTAEFSGGRPLSVISDNISAGAFLDNQGAGLQTEYDGISRKLTISAPVVQGLNVVRIAVADTGDSSLDSGLFVSNLRAGGFSSAGAKVFVSAGAQKNVDNVLVSSGVDLDEFFDAGAGNDYVDGGGGDDILDLGDGDDVGIGGAGNDEVLGGNGNDILVAGEGSGDDIYDGGSGSDNITFESANSPLTLDLAAGTAHSADTGYDTIVNVENVLGGSGSDFIAGDDGPNELLGGAGDDTLLGRGGDDVLGGGGGDDQLGGGGGEDSLFGGPGADALFGGPDADTLGGGADDDVLRGGGGDDKLLGGPGADRMFGGPGGDVMRAGGGDDMLRGGGGDDRMFGGPGNDRLLAGPGKDVLIGGAGGDVFLYQAAAHVGTGSSRDIIKDFQPGQDMLSLRKIDANTLVGGDQDFTFIGGANFSAAGQLRYDSGVLAGDVNGDGMADFEIRFINSAAVSGDDIIL